MTSDDEALVAQVVDRLADDTIVDGTVSELVLAALLGEEELAAAVGGDRPEAPQLESIDESPAVATYVTSVTVEGFRGAGPEATLDVMPGPGLTLVVGRNGSGKSTFAEGLELLLTGENRRWVGKKTTMWKEGWRNLHHDEPTRLSATFAVDSAAGATTVSRIWSAGVGLDESTMEVSGAAAASFADLGWAQPLVAYRPFLSYDELGSMVDEVPSALFDRLSTILGLEDLVRAEQRLKKERQAAEAAPKAAKEALKAWRSKLDGLDDDRAHRCLAATKGTRWDLATVGSLVSATDVGEEESELHVLAQLAQVTAPSLDAVDQSTRRLRTAAGAVQDLADTDAAHAQRLAALLQQAIDYHDIHDANDCPVCGRADGMVGPWRADAVDQVARLRQQATAFDSAQAELRAAEASARAHIGSPPGSVGEAAALGFGEALEVAWSAWAAISDRATPDQLADHLDAHVVALHDAIATTSAAASAEWDRRQDAWRPLALEIAEWLTVAEAAQHAATVVKDTKAAEKWVQDAAKDIRAERFAPIAARVKELWELLRTQSNVTLDDVTLEGASTRRRVDLSVSVDDVNGVALGVMSQGELHALALCLFLPRATLTESPFRFVLIDDPVQAMDPARVDGLAQLLGQVATDRQVIVFTHDDRLPEAVQRLAIDARVLEVHRRPGSLVEIRPGLDPVARNIADARAIVLTEGLPDTVARRVVPNFCRQAIEAVCCDVVRRRRLERGDAHGDVEAALLAAKTLKQRIALALFDDAGRSGDAIGTLRSQYGPRFADTADALNKGSHGATHAHLKNMVDDTEKLSRQLASKK